MDIVIMGALGGAIALLAWTKERRRARRRNRRGACAACGSRWGEVGSEDPYLIHGRLVCGTCAERARRRVPFQLATLVLATAFSSGMIAVGEGSISAILFPASTTLVMTLGVVHWMKSANRRAVRRIATGEFPDFDAVSSGSGLGPPSQRLVDASRRSSAQTESGRDS